MLAGASLPFPPIGVFNLGTGLGAGAGREAHGRGPIHPALHVNYRLAGLIITVPDSPLQPLLHPHYMSAALTPRRLAGLIITVPDGPPSPAPPLFLASLRVVPKVPLTKMSGCLGHG
jgi:hypothetical protein